MSWQPDIGSEITRRALEEARGRGQLRTTPGASNVQEAIFKSQLQKSKNKPASPKPVSDSTRQSLTEGSIKLMEKEKQRRGAAITRHAMGLENTDPRKGVVTHFDPDDFKSNIIRDSIQSNWKTGGRHPDAAPLKSDKPKTGSDENKGDPAPRPALDRSNGTQTSPGGGGVMTPADLDAFVSRLSNTDPEKGIAYGIQFRTGFQSGALPGVKAGKGANIPEGADEEAIVDLVDQGSRYNVGNSDDAGTGYYKPTGSDPTDARNGISPVADAAEMKSSVPVGVDDRFADGADYGDDDQYVSPGFSARSRAFLDYDGPGGAAMALRAAEASQGYIRQNDRNFAITGTGEDGKRTFGEFDNKGRRALVKDGNSSISHSFMDTYGVTPKESTDSAVPTPDEAQSPEIGYTTKLDMDPVSKQHYADEVNFGVGDATFDQLEDYEGNAAKQTIEPVDWMNIYRGK